MRSTTIRTGQDQDRGQSQGQGHRHDQDQGRSQGLAPDQARLPENYPEKIRGCPEDN